MQGILFPARHRFASLPRATDHSVSSSLEMVNLYGTLSKALENSVSLHLVWGALLCRKNKNVIFWVHKVIAEGWDSVVAYASDNMTAVIGRMPDKARKLVKDLPRLHSRMLGASEQKAII